MLTAGSASHCCYNSGRDTWNGTQGLTGTGQALCQWTLTPAFKFQMSKYLQRTWNYVTTSVVWSVERMNQSGDTVASTMSKSPSRTWWLKWQPLKFKKLLASNWFGLFLLLNTCQLKIFIISMVYGWAHSWQGRGVPGQVLSFHFYIGFSNWIQALGLVRQARFPSRSSCLLWLSSSVKFCSCVLRQGLAWKYLTRLAVNLQSSRVLGFWVWASVSGLLAPWLCLAVFFMVCFTVGTYGRCWFSMKNT